MKILKSTKSKIDKKLVIETYYDDIYKYALFLTKSKDVAEDVVQDTFEKFILNSKSIKDPKKVKSWLITTLRRTFFSNKKRYEKYILSEENEIEFLINDSNIENNILSRDNIIDVKEAISKLDEKYKEPLLLQSVLGMTTKEISEELGLDENTVLTRIFRAKSKVKEVFFSENEHKNDRRQK